MSLRRNRMKGISFHHRTSKISAKHKHRLKDFFNLDELYLQIKNETPTPFNNQDIKRFLGDHGRNEINSQISRCIDTSTKWSGILNVVERCFPQKAFLHPEYLIQNEHSTIEEEVEVYLLIKKSIALWKHNLHILEMTAQAQIYSTRQLR